MNAIIDKVEKSFLKKNAPVFRVGDTLRVDVKIVEGQSERLQAFEGVVIRKKGHGIAATFTIRKVSFGIGIERTFPLHSPKLENFKVIRSGRVRRAKLYYLRNLTGKAARIQDQNTKETKKPQAPKPSASEGTEPNNTPPLQAAETQTS